MPMLDFDLRYLRNGARYKKGNFQFEFSELSGNAYFYPPLMHSCRNTSKSSVPLPPTSEVALKVLNVTSIVN